MNPVKCFFIPAILVWSSCTGKKEKTQADIILFNGNVITVDSTDRLAEALAIKGNKIIAVGKNGEIEALASSSTQRIDLKGHTVTPGLLDAHIHLSSSPWSVPNMIELSYPAVKSVSDVKQLIAAKVKTVKPGEWIRGVGWDEGKLNEKRLITAADLDEVSPANPVWLTNTTGHYGVANSQALHLAEVTPSTPDPAEGIIDKDKKGKPTGVLKESAMDLVVSKLPPITVSDIKRGITQMTHNLQQEGMTGVKDPGLSQMEWNAYQSLADSSRLQLRVFGLWMGGKSTTSMQQAIAWQQSVPPQYRIGNDLLISGGIKLFGDGSGGARTAWVHEEWNKNRTERDAGNFGFPNIQPDTLKAMIRMAHDKGVHISTHAIGDHTIDVVVDSYAEVLKARPTAHLRHGIIHCNIPTPHAIEVISQLQTQYDAGYPEPSATFTWWIGDMYAGSFGERTKILNPFATFMKNGIIWANGSDYSVTPFPARYGIWAAVARQPALGTYAGDPFGREESVDVKSALKAVTIWAAHQMFMEDKIGSLEPGKLADIAVWDRDLYTIPVGEIKDMKCMMTIFNGKVMYLKTTQQ